MTSQPIIHKYHFNDMREQIFAKLEKILQKDNNLSVSKTKGYKYLKAEYSILGVKTDTILVLVNDNVLIQNSSPERTDILDRLWMFDSFIGAITYIELDNLDLRNAYKYNPKDPSGNAYEMHAMPEDLQLITKHLDKILQLSDKNMLINSSKTENYINKFLP
jgi:hypothetical protein